MLHWTARDLASPLNCTRGKLKEPSKTFGLGNPAPGGLSMPQADGKTSFQSAGAKESSQNTSDTQQTSNIPEWTLPWLPVCANHAVCTSPRAHTAILSSAQLSCLAMLLPPLNTGHHPRSAFNPYSAMGTENQVHAK